jgi:hypothetical protein
VSGAESGASGGASTYGEIAYDAVECKAAWRHAARKLVPNTWLRGDGTQLRARNGTHRGNPPGSHLKYSRNKSSRCSLTFQHLRFDHGLMSRAGTQARFGKATARIPGTGRRWRNSLASRSRTRKRTR